MTTSGACPRIAWYKAPTVLPRPGLLGFARARASGGARVPVPVHEGDGFLQRKGVLHPRVFADGIQEPLLHGPRVAEHVLDAVCQELLDDREAAGLLSRGRLFGAPLLPHLPPPTPKIILQDIDEKLTALAGIRRRAAGDEGVVDDRRELPSDTAVVAAIGTGGVTKDELQGVRGGPMLKSVPMKPVPSL